MDSRNDMSGSVTGPLIQARDVAFTEPAPVALAGLPPVDLFAGRAAALDALAQSLRPSQDPAASPPVVLSVVTGLAGVGKTTLAVRAAHDAVAAGWFPGGVLFIDLQGYDERARLTPDVALSTFLRALGVHAEHIPDERAGREALYRSKLAELPPALVVLDNASSADQVRPLLPGTRTHRVLVTSRDTPGDLMGARLLDLNVLDPAEAVSLLDGAVRAARPEDDRVVADPEAAAELVRLCGHLPLALSIVAATLVADPDQPLDALVAALGEASTRLGELSFGDSPRVRAAFDLSYHRLTPAAARLFRLLSLNPGRQVGVAAASALADLPPREAEKLLTSLRRAHMIEAGEPRGWFRWHDLLRLYAKERVAADEPAAERERAVVRLLDHYAEATRRADARRNPAHEISREALAWFDVEHPTLVDAVLVADREGHPERALRLAFLLTGFLFYRRHWDDCRMLYAFALETAKRIGDRAAEAQAVHRLARLGRDTRHRQEARRWYREFLALSRESGDRPGTAQALHNLGSIARRARELHAAQEYYDEALDLYRELGDWRGEADILFNLGTVARERRRHGSAYEYYTAAMRLATEHADRLREARVSVSRGILSRRLHDHEMARHWWREAIRRYEELGRDDMVRSVRKRLAKLPPTSPTAPASPPSESPPPIPPQSPQIPPESHPQSPPHLPSG
ncbi:ATP-binding protein [Saccharothrix sp. NRRL B-16348]|uniref:ATP-binding protein n=1 Tax=Saccharothrix sp. NRRL B-16348 TaxID=1415542 RepID=UPI000AA6F261|nr:tetratricopeptide repeat protein [Saccharothrix sp. NRRL B-16348]